MFSWCVLLCKTSNAIGSKKAGHKNLQVPRDALFYQWDPVGLDGTYVESIAPILSFLTGTENHRNTADRA